MFRRGFKTWAEETALRVRQRLRLPAESSLDPLRLAEILGVAVLIPDELTDLDVECRARLLHDHSDNWSAITVSANGHFLVVLNPEHAHTRRNSTLAHELAHIILGHEPSLMFVSAISGSALRTYNPQQEEEANWLAGCLLLPRDALFSIRRRRLSAEEACSQYGVSPAMLRFRFNTSGVDVQLRRARSGGS